VTYGDGSGLKWREATGSPSIGFTLSRVSTVFTCLAITPLEVNRFGWNLGHSEYIGILERCILDDCWLQCKLQLI